MSKKRKEGIRGDSLLRSRHSVLIVSASEQFDADVRKTLKGFIMVDSGKSVAAARRLFLERYYDIIIINAPIPGEPAEQFALEAAEQSKASVLLVVPSEVYDLVLENVTDYGVLVISKPVPRGRMDQAIRFLMAIQNQMHELQEKLEKSEERMEELRIVSKAKLYLVETEHMTEDEAHRYIGKLAMDHGVSRRRVAEQILEDED